MENIRNEIVRSINKNGLKVNCLAMQDAKLVFDLLVEKFCNNDKYTFPLWENLKESFSICDSSGWQIINKLPYKGTIYFFAEPDESLNLFVLNDLKNATDIVGECFGFVFYISNPNLDFLVCFNDHDYLISSGEAISWLQNIIT